MKRKFALLAAAALLFAAGCASVPPPKEETDKAPETKPKNTVVKTIADTDEVLLNPGKGFVYYGGDSATSKKVAPYYTTGYHRFSWADIEPEDGQYNFEKIDHQIDYYKSQGKTFGFGVMCCNSSSDEMYITPEFVFDKGAGFDISTKSNGVRQVIPKWDDEIYLSEVDEFVAALGERYDGNADVVFLDILSYGNWGEQHLFGLDTGDPDYSYKGRVSPEFFRDRYVRPYMEAFPNTLLFNPWGYDALNDVYEALIEEGVSVRRDGIVKYTNGLDVLAKAYGKLPVAFEYAEKYSHYIDDGREDYFNERLMEAIEVAKPSYIQLDIDWFDNNLELCKTLANRMGYYFRLKEAEYTEKVAAGETLEVRLRFLNDGVAPIYEPCTLYLGLLDEEGNLAERIPTSAVPENWLPGEAAEERISVPFDGLPAGNYRLAAGLFRNGEDEAPCYLLGSEGKTEDNWYVFGRTAIG